MKKKKKHYWNNVYLLIKKVDGRQLDQPQQCLPAVATTTFLLPIKLKVLEGPESSHSIPYEDFHLASLPLFYLLCPLSCQLITAFLPLSLAYPPVLHDLHRFPIFFHTKLTIHTLFAFLRQILSYSKYLSFTLSRPSSLSVILAKPRKHHTTTLIHRLD